MLVPFFWSSHKSRWPLPCLFHSLTQSRHPYLVGPVLLVISQVPLAPTSPVSFISLSHTKQTTIPCWSPSSGRLTSPAGPLPCLSHSSRYLTQRRHRYLVGPVLLVVSQVPLAPASPVSFSHTKQTSYLVGPVLLVVSQVPLAPYLSHSSHSLTQSRPLTLLVPFFWLSRKSSRQVRSVISDWLMLPASFRRSPALRVRLVRSLPARSTSES